MLYDKYIILAKFEKNNLKHSIIQNIANFYMQ